MRTSSSTTPTTFALVAIVILALLGCDAPNHADDLTIQTTTVDHVQLSRHLPDSTARAYVPPAMPASTGAPTLQVPVTVSRQLSKNDGPTPRSIFDHAEEPCSHRNDVGISCEARNVSYLTLFRPEFAKAMFEYELPTVEQLMESGWNNAGASPTYVIAQTSTIPETVRCNWHSLAMATTQREGIVRAWLNYTENEPLPDPTTISNDFNELVNLLDPRYRDSIRANFNHLAYGGVFDEGPVLACYADFTATYLLGNGPPVITVAYDHLAKTRSYDLYQKAHAAGRYGTATLMTKAEYDAQEQATLNAAKQQLTDALNNRSSIIFLAPMGAHYSIAIEAWQAIAQWDLQRDGDTVNAVRYGAGPGDTDYSVPLDTMRSRITAAANSDAHAGKRIANITGLNDYYHDIGAYGNIAAPGQPEVIFTPELPPAAPGATAPANLSARETRTAVTIGWTPINSPSIVGYRVLRRIANRETDFTTLVDNASRTDISYTDRDVKLGLTYIYRVQALGPSGSIESSKRITASPGPLPAPQNAAAVATSDAITLTWNRQDWDAIDIAAITGYRILRRVQGELEFTEVGTTNAATFTYNDQSGILPDTHYIYRIEAVADHGNSVGARATARTAPAP